MKKNRFCALSFIFMATCLSALFSFSSGASIPKVTGITAQDLTKKKWNIDSLLNAGKVLALHQVYTS